MTFCVTGTMAAGKNTVSALLEDAGFKSIDADSVVHEVLKTPAVKQHIRAEFETETRQNGITLFQADGALDRRALARLIFAEPNRIARQEAIVYPAVTEHILHFLEQHKNTPTVINATVLYKIPRLMDCVTKILYVDAPFWLRYIRAKKRDGLSSAQILQRFKAQKHLFAKYESFNADIVRVWNVGSKAHLQKAVKKVLICKNTSLNQSQ